MIIKRIQKSFWPIQILGNLDYTSIFMLVSQDNMLVSQGTFTSY